MDWQGEAPHSSGRTKVNFIADEAYEVTPLHDGFAGAMNQLAAKQVFNKWEVNSTQKHNGQSLSAFWIGRWTNLW